MSARELTWAALTAMPEERQRAIWHDILARWQHNAERKRDADCEFDHSEELRAWLDGARK